MPEQLFDGVVYKVQGKEALDEPDSIRLSSILVTNRDERHFRLFVHLEGIYVFIYENKRNHRVDF